MKEENHCKVEEQIKAGKYLVAAQLLEDFRTPANLARDLVHIFSSERLKEKQNVLQKQAIFLLPLLFRGLVLTTNFDETLELVYRECERPLEVSHPGHSELLEQLLRHPDSSGLFKLHGTIQGDHVEYGNIVFTEQQYNRHYAKDSALTRDLINCLEKRLILFLGCSLGTDRTMELLQETIRPGDMYYTIINCEKSERDDKIIELGKKQIRAILYEGERHEAVRVILEHLLEETDPEAYRLLSYHEGALPKTEIDHRFSYDAEIVPLAGREDELRELQAFLGDAAVPFRWWAVTGPGGAGKSRLAFEFQKQVQAEWKVHYLSTEEYSKLSEVSARLTGKTLLIADYVQEHARELGVWMEELNAQKRSLPLRLLLVERQSRENAENADGEKQVHGTDTAWEKQLYCAVRHERELRNACFRENFLSLQPLSDGDLKEIIKAYAAAIKPGEKELSAEKTELLLKKLKEIDPELCRPLYAMFLTDAFMEGMAPEHWNQESVLDYMLEREQKRLEFRLRQVMGLQTEDERLSAVCQYFLCLATVWQDAEVRKVRELCPEEWKKLEEKTEQLEKPEELLKRIGMAGLVADIEKVLALRPDLVGEYYVYDWLIRQQKETAERFLKTVWQQPFPAAVFFDRLMHDYGYLLNETPGNWEVVVPDRFSMSGEAATVCSIFLVNATAYCMDVYQCKKVAGLLEEFSDEHPESAKIALEFAKGLVNLSCDQEERGAKETVSLLYKYA
ncbi:MAG: SIR2 family protein, partial [Lachnospiraceae bacterium]|nr:SIR2 family protein [Lachnospiraceae bacterium]